MNSNQLQRLAFRTVNHSNETDYYIIRLAVVTLDIEQFREYHSWVIKMDKSNQYTKNFDNWIRGANADLKQYGYPPMK